MQETVLNGESMNIVEDNIEKLKSIFPDVFTEGKVDFDKLQDVLGNYIEKRDERYNFTWNGKSAALRLAQTPSTGTLRPCKEESKDWNTTENLYIEGDNLEVLKLLQKSYHNKIKMIYIDPPYNTGNDFVYKDDFKDNIENYKKTTGQIDEEGNKISTNSESDGRYHTNWLNMIYPRLRLARNLLSNEGAIFISIDDNEVRNLRIVCDEIFGEDNFVAQFPWRKRTAKSDVPYGVSQDYEWVVCYAKTSMFRASVEGKPRKYYETPDFPGRPWRIHDMTKQTTASERPNSYFTMINPKNGDEYPCDPNRTWRITKDTFQKYYDANEIVFPGDYDFLNISKPQARYFKDKDMEKDGDNFGRVALSTKFPDDIGMSQDGTKEIKTIFESIVFSFPKTSNFIKYFLNATTQSNDIILDFFSGSATTAHAVMQLNAEDNGNRKFIMVQLPEITNEKSEAFKAGYKNICEIGKERIRRAGDKIKEEIESSNLQLKLGESQKEVPDIGFKVFKLDTSNIKKWNGNADTIESEIQGSIFNYEVGRSELDVVYEIMLKCGLDLTYPIEEINVKGKTLYSIGASAMFVCMDKDITQDIADKIVEIKDANDIVEPVAVFKDNGFTTDSNKTNIKETLRVAGIKDFITV
ncbi:MAG: site-specific DNA-methyltransferase [Bacteroidales bacterium]|nr:site-specific DNA-methyltransferase [Bacteroidales bacterium]